MAPNSSPCVLYNRSPVWIIIPYMYLLCTSLHKSILQTKIFNFWYFIHSFHFIGMYRMRRFLAVLRSFFHSSLSYTLSFHPLPPTILPSALTSFCHLFLGLPHSLVAAKFIYFIPFSVHAQTNNLFNLTVFVIVGF